MKNKLETIFDLLNVLAVAKNQPQTSERLKIYCQALSALPMEKIEKSISWHIKKSRFFPQIVEIVDRISPEENPEDTAVEMAGAILDCISRFGSYQSKSAQRYLGDTAWFAVIRFGGWTSLCKTEYSQLPAIRAQLKSVCKAVVNMQGRDSSNLLEFQKNGDEEINSNNQLKALSYNL